MHRSPRGSPHGPGELRRVADELFEAVRAASRSDTWAGLDLQRSDALAANLEIEHRHLAVHSMLCIQRLHLLGTSMDAYDPDEAFVLLNALNVLIQRLLDGATEDSSSIRRLHDAHGRLIHLAIGLGNGVYDDHVEPEGS
jgi:hypothetical protein